ncbi:MAG: M24 family metallopeptidase [Actinomycetota bacterium]
MPYLTNNPQAVRRATGFDPWAHSLPPKLAIDGYRSTMPLMSVAEDGIPALFLKEIDRTNVEHLRPDGARCVWYSPYFSFGGLREPSDAYPDLAAAVQSELTGHIELDSGMPIELFRELRQALGSSEPKGPSFEPPRNHYVIARDDVAASFARGRTELQEAAAPLVRDLESDRLAPWMARAPGNRFASLDRMLEEAALDGILVASPVAVQDLTGIPMRAIGEDAWALYPKGSSVVHLLARTELPWVGLPLSRPARAASVKELAGGSRLGFEEVALSFEAWSGFGLEELECEPATGLVRRWRELRSWEDLAACIIGARVTLEAIRSALGFVERELAARRRVSELDAYNRYRSRVESFIRDRGLPIRVRTYFTHTHAGDRSHFPASATDHEINAGSSLKIDGGLEIYDSRGMFLGVSDITRSAVGSPRARSFYELLDRALLEGAIAACRPGVKGADVFAAGLAWLEPHRDEIIEGGFMPASEAPLGDLFRRNIGHLIGKQEPATVEFRAGDNRSLEAGMIAAAEFQWPHAGYCIGTEDIFLITAEGPLNLTRPV